MFGPQTYTHTHTHTQTYSSIFHQAVWRYQHMLTFEDPDSVQSSSADVEMGPGRVDGASKDPGLPVRVEESGLCPQRQVIPAPGILCGQS